MIRESYNILFAQNRSEAVCTYNSNHSSVNSLPGSQYLNWLSEAQ